MFYKNVAAIVLLGLPGAVALAQNQAFSVQAGAGLKVVDNANYAPNEASALDEQQHALSLSAAGELRGAWSYLKADGKLSSTRYTEQQNLNRDWFLGDLFLRIGRDSSLLVLDLKHSAEEVSIDPTLGTAALNQDSRAISSAELSANMRPAAGTALTLGVSVDETKFDLTTDNNSRRVGASLSVQRQVSPTLSLGASVSYRQAEFEQDNLESETNSVALFAAWKLRRAQYSFSIGNDSSEFAGAKSDTLNARAEWAYDSGVSNFSLSAAQWLADTSVGDGNRQNSANQGGQDGNLGVLDQYTNRQINAQWLFLGACSRCNLSLALEYHKEIYERFQAFNISDSALVAGFEYELRDNWSTYIKWTFSSVIFEFSQQFSDYEANFVEVGTDLRYFRRLPISLFAGFQNRSFDNNLRDFESSYLGLNISYQLYTR